ncbi:MAG: TetR/AcrR family transcriptional regulator [Lachnospiraceae bacterium]|nr:TetR/AcrR family transcriptional regulator [Lachnospiraceae bacterium]
MKERILEVARKEFIGKGFYDASMRSIAGEIGITATALYRHYKDKEEIFEAVVYPAVRDWERLCDSESKRQTGIGRKDGLEAMWENDVQVERIVDMIYKRFDEHKLLFFGSKGTKYEDYLHHIVTRVQTETLKFMKELEGNGIRVNEVDEKDMHLLLSAQYTAMLEMVKHDYSYDEALKYAGTVAVFFVEGWRKYLGF